MNCPKCKASLDKVAEISVNDCTCDVYQCETCTRDWEFGDSTFEGALTFAVNPSGQLIDPDSLAPISLN